MTPKQDTRPARPQTERQVAFLARLRDKGLGLAPVMADGKIVRLKASSKQAAGGGAGRGRTAPQGPAGVITRRASSDRSTGHTAPGEFTLWVPAPAAFLNLNDRMHHHPKARLVKAWRAAAKDAAEAAGLPRGFGRVHVGIDVVKVTSRAYDVHNLMPTAKACIDGLVDFGLVADDSNDYLTGPDMRPGGTGPAGLRVIIRALLSS